MAVLNVFQSAMVPTQTKKLVWLGLADRLRFLAEVSECGVAFLGRRFPQLLGHFVDLGGVLVVEYYRLMAATNGGGFGVDVIGEPSISASKPSPPTSSWTSRRSLQ